MRFASLFTALSGIAIAGGTTYLARDYLTPKPVEPEIGVQSQHRHPVDAEHHHLAAHHCRGLDDEQDQR